MANAFDQEVFAAMQTGSPFKSYKKTITAKVHVIVLNPFNQEPMGRVLEGDGEDAIVHTWTVMEDAFFTRMNKRHFERGIIIPYVKPQEVQETNRIEQASDDELKNIVNDKFMSLRAVLAKTDSDALVNRLLTIARAEDKSEKIINAIEKRLVEITNSNLPSQEEE